MDHFVFLVRFRWISNAHCVSIFGLGTTATEVASCLDADGFVFVTEHDQILHLVKIRPHSRKMLSWTKVPNPFFHMILEGARVWIRRGKRPLIL